MTGLKKWMLILGLVFHFHSEAQSFAWRSTLDSVPQSGFYSIPLSLDWLVHLKTDLSDIRIKGEKNEPVPFVLKTHPSEQNSSFINFPILENVTDTVSTTLQLDATRQQGTDHLYLVMGNHAAERFASLSGSNDKIHWFIIDEKLPLTNRPALVTDRFVQRLSFPFIRYHYLKLSINNKGTDPLPLLKAGIYADTGVKEYLPLNLEPGTTFNQKDSSDGRTYIHVHNSRSYPVDRISMKLSGPKFFRRLLNVYKIEAQSTKELLGSTEVSSEEEPAIWIMGGKVQNFLMVIENGDNPPLQVNAINTQCRRQELIAYLEKRKQYVLVGGNESVNFPDYDLAYFHDRIPSQLPTLEPGNVVPYHENAVSTSADKSWWIWPAVIVMIVVLALLTYKLMGEMRKAKEL